VLPCAGEIKAGGACRGEYAMRYNHLLCFDEEPGPRTTFPGKQESVRAAAMKKISPEGDFFLRKEERSATKRNTWTSAYNHVSNS
jgi:hypothetical protein